MALVTLVAAAAYALITLDARRDAVIREADGKLLVGAYAVRTGLGPDYHDRIFDSRSVAPLEFERIVRNHDELCRETGLQYLWSVMLLNGKLVFTSATHSMLNDPASECAGFLEEHTDPGVYAEALRTMRPVFTTFNNKWGTGRMVLLPDYDKHQRPHIHAASISLVQLERAVARTAAESIAVSTVIALVAFVASYLLARWLARPLIRLTDAAQQMAQGDLDVQLVPGGSRELTLLYQSLDRMRTAIRTQFNALRQEIVVRREAEQRLRASERHFARAAERNQRLVQELEHRVRNNLAGLIGLVGLMKSTSRDVETFANAIEGRLRAMSLVQRLLVESGWGQVDLRGLVISAIDAMRPLARHEIPVEFIGPPLPLMPEQVTPLTLVFAEWFTNSTKYGAHSVPQGRLKIAWEAQLQAHEPQIRLTWQERGGPRIDKPVSPSLGTDLVYGFVTRELRGQCWVQFPPEGADHAIEFPCAVSSLPPAPAPAPTPRIST